jgi:small ligand-binding sensory domain FIST
MAKVEEEVLVIKITTLLPDTAEVTEIMGEENMAALQKIIEELSGNNRTLVEVIKG